MRPFRFVSLVALSSLAVLSVACAPEAGPNDADLAPVTEDEITGGRLEAVPPNEAANTRRLAEIFTENIRKDAIETDGRARRGVHPKSHGCVKAHVTTSDSPLPAGLSSPVFRAGQEYDAWIRFSNANRKMQKDQAGDARGMAIKLLGVKGKKVLGGVDADATTQDLTLQSHPVFIIKNIEDFLVFAEASKDEKVPVDFFFPEINPFKWRIHEGKIAVAIRAKKFDSPLHANYYSMAPMLFGTSAAKVAARPCAPFQPPSRLPSSPNYLREALKSSLADGEACFDLLVQKQGDPREMPVEDATVEWDESKSPFVPVARVTIPKQTFDSPEQEAYCESLSFTPWHAVREHRPLGGLNRGRKVIYETSMKVRQEANGLPRAVEPKDLRVPGL